MNVFWNCLKAALLTSIALTPPLAVSAPQLSYQILRSKPHNPGIFTQGLVKTPAGFYETGGRYGQSRLLQYTHERDPANRHLNTPNTSGHYQLLQERRLPAHLFAEGLTLWGDQLIVLTWKAGKALVFDRHTLTPLRKFSYPGQGWGLTHNGTHLIMSDGSHYLTFRDPKDFQVVKTLAVKHNRRPWPRLNELEFINGEIWANTWIDDRIVTIAPDTGQVTGILDLSTLSRKHRLNATDRVLNGIAYDAQLQAVWVTGKNWPRMYLLKVDL